MQNCPLGHDPNALGFFQRNLFAAEGTLRIINERNEFTSFDISTIFYIITAEETEKMKNGNKNRKMGTLFLFFKFFVVVFVGFCICSVFGIVIHCIFNGFGDFLLKIIDLPYLLYLLFSLIISLILIFRIR